MSVLPGSLFWERRDTTGAEHVLVDVRRGLHARGVALAVDPIPYTATYEIRTDAEWLTTVCEVRAAGEGWVRTVTISAAGVTAAEEGDLDAALTAAGHPSAGLPGAEEPELLVGVFDVDLTGSPLTNTLPIRRLGLLRAEPGVAHRVRVAWVLLPSLEVVLADQIYTMLDAGRVRFANETFSADLTVDADGFVLDYPGLCTRRL
ncbi:putative glycolipid-binding domain-containing protein [Actinoplanes sp. NPDC051859]|uniref:putative glycolipid-binding domain-containing protein n=1 Tax=Actinoplanes sp. NPDC051859 TaxID=3363909 RepID=UPI0037BB3D66